MSEVKVSRVLDTKEVFSILESSFHPLECVAELIDYKSQMRFRIFDQAGNPLVSWPEINLSTICNETTLQEIIETTKTKLKQRGVQLS